MIMDQSGLVDVNTSVFGSIFSQRVQPVVQVLPRLVSQRRTIQCSSALVGIRKSLNTSWFEVTQKKIEGFLPLVSPHLRSLLQGCSCTRYALDFGAAKMFETTGDLFPCRSVNNVFSQYSQTVKHPLMLCDYAKEDRRLLPLVSGHLGSPMQGCSYTHFVSLFGVAKLTGSTDDRLQCLCKIESVI